MRINLQGTLRSHLVNLGKDLRIDGVESVGMQIQGPESEYLELRFLDSPAEVCLIRHGMGFPEGGECVYSELMDDA